MIDIIVTSHEQRQRFLMNLATSTLSWKGRQYESRVDNLALLLSIKGDLEPEDMELIMKFTNAVSVMVAYYSDMGKKVLNKEDVSSPRYRAYKEAIAICFNLWIFNIDKITTKLLEGVDLANFTVPSAYWVYAKEELKQMPDEEEDSYNDYMVDKDESSEE